MKRGLILVVLLLNFMVSWTQTEFITTWVTSNPGNSNSTSIEIPVDTSLNYNYDVDWNNDGVFDTFGVTDTIVHDFGVAGTYTIRIQGVFPRIYFENANDPLKIVDVVQWGNNQWSNMQRAFVGCENLNFSATDAPDLSNVTSLRMLLSRATAFNSDIEHWDVSNIDDFHRMLEFCTNFNQPMDGWDMSSATNTDRMFLHCSVFNQPLNSWDMSSVTTTAAMFDNASSFNQPLSNWDLSSVIHMSAMFVSATNFNQDISMWNISSAVAIHRMFQLATSFNQPIGSWDISSASSLFAMFDRATSFNQPLNTWNTSNITNMERMFSSADAFNQPLNNWDMSSVTRIGRMFEHTDIFNQDLNTWDVSNVTMMNSAFRSTVAFNGDISNWDVSSVTLMNSMFEDAQAIDQDFSSWNVVSVTTMERMFNGSGLSTLFYDSLLISWSQLPLQNNVLFHAGSSVYCRAWAERDTIINKFAWTITDGGAESVPPTALCRDTTLYLIPLTSITLDPLDLDSGSFDTCTSVIVTASQTTFTCSDIGVLNDTLTVSDMNGNSATCISVINVMDTTTNLFKTCPNDTSINVNNALCTAVANWTPPTTRCDVISLTSTHQPGDTLPIGITVVTYVATNVVAATDTCRFNVTVLPSNLAITVDSSRSPTCSDVPDGEAFITVSGGISPFTYDWSNDGINDNDDPEDITGLVSDTFYINVIDSLDCVANDSITITTNSSAFALCPGDTSVRANVTNCRATVNFTEPLTACTETALTSNFMSGDTFNIGTTPVIYTSTDSLGNVSNCSFDVTVFDDLTVQIDSAQNPSCSDIADGQAFITIVGGSSPYQYDWSHDGVGDLDDNEDQVGLMSGSFYVTVVDTFGCTQNDSIALSTNSSAFALCPGDTSINANTTNCRAVVNFVVPTTVCNETALASNFSPGDTFNIGTTTIQYTSTDSLGNISNCSFDVTVLNDLSVQIDSSQSPSCSNIPDGQGFITINGGSSPYQYDWDHDGVGDFDDDEDQAGLIGGQFLIEIRDAAGCSVVDSIMLTSNPSGLSNCPLDTTLQANADNCTGIVSWISPTSLCAGTSISSNFSPGDTFNIGTTTITYTSTDSLNNTSTCSFNITVFNDVSVSIDSVSAASTSAKIYSSVVGGNQPYSTTWAYEGSLNTNDSLVLTALQEGNYEVTVTDSVGCESSAFTIVNFKDSASIDYPTYTPIVFTPNADGINDIFMLGSDYNEAKELTIYNRWGQVIFYTATPSIGWDGRTTGSLEAPAGAYFYSIVTAENKVVSGAITLLR